MMRSLLVLFAMRFASALQPPQAAVLRGSVKRSTPLYPPPGGAVVAADRRALWGEALGTMVLTFLGTGAVAAASSGYPTANLGSIAAAWAAGVAVAVACTGNASGAHLNPAVTLAMVLFRKMKKRLAALYCGAQLTGATAGAALTMALYGPLLKSMPPPGVMAPSPRLAPAVAAFAEFIATAILGFVVFAVTDETQPDHVKNNAPVFIGLTVFALINTVAPLTAAGLNPARDLGPRLVALACRWPGAFEGCWLLIYTLAPLAGASFGALVSKLLL